jgi:hypothetical protein
VAKGRHDHNDAWIVLSRHDGKAAATRLARRTTMPGHAVVAMMADDQRWEVVAIPRSGAGDFAPAPLAVAEIHDVSPGAGYYLGAGAGAFELTVSRDFAAELPALLPLAPPPGPDASPEDFAAWFELVTKRTAAEVKIRSELAEKQALADYEAGIKSIPVYGPIAAPIAKIWAKVGIALGKTLSTWLYGKSDWDDPKYVHEAFVLLHMLYLKGWLGFGPQGGEYPDHAIDWAGSLRDQLNRYLLRLERTYPSVDAELKRAVQWAFDNPEDPRVVALRLGGSFPLPLPRGSHLAPSAIAGIAGLMAAFYSVNARELTEQAARDALWLSSTDVRGPDGIPYRLTDSTDAIPELIRRIVAHAAELPRLDLASTAEAFGDHTSPLTYSGPDGGSAGDGGGAAAVGLAALAAAFLL